MGEKAQKATLLGTRFVRFCEDELIFIELYT